LPSTTILYSQHPGQIFLSQKITVKGAIDGSKFRAVNGRKKMYNQEILKKKLLRIEENITSYLKSLDQADRMIREPHTILPVRSKQSLPNLKSVRGCMKPI
jgi:hypothetical protein